MEQVQTLGQGVDELLVLGSILTQVHLRLAVAGVVVVLALVQEVAVGLIVVLVDDRHAQLVGQLPAILEVGITGVRTRTGGTHDDNLGVGLGDTLIDILETLCKLRRDLLLVAQTQIFQVEGFGMTGISTHLSPFIRGRVAIGPLDEVDSLGHPLVHLAHRNGILCLCGVHVPSTIGTLTADTAGEDRQGLHAEVLTELEILEIAETHALMITPGILQALTLLLRTDGGLPAVGIPEAVATAMNDTAARETHELRLQVSQCLSEVLSEAMTLIGILGHQ